MDQLQPYASTIGVLILLIMLFSALGDISQTAKTVEQLSKTLASVATGETMRHSVGPIAGDLYQLRRDINIELVELKKELSEVNRNLNYLENLIVEIHSPPTEPQKVTRTRRVADAAGGLQVPYQGYRRS